MYLSKLDIFGFKSFANKTSIVLNDGVTAIVGPNGCGKTNIVDALRWSLGEQRYSTLRSDKMEDVIFNGTKARKPIGLAEVSLTIQNNKGVLPLDYNELTITRRVYRSGDSEYLLNKVPCRLKDIVSLFMDTGMGSNAYSVIELKMVETILSDKVEERRRLFEEAAGVTKYKARRKEALRKLSDVEADMLRVEDIISEVSKAVNSLNRQAKKAERYNEYNERLRALEIDVLQRDYTNLVVRLEPLEERLSVAREERASSSSQLEQEEALLHAQRSEERDIEEKLDAARRTHADLVARINSDEQNQRVSEERRIALERTVERMTEARLTADERLDELERSKTALTTELEALAEELTALEEANQERRSAHVALEDEVAQKKVAAQARQTRRMEYMQELARLTSESDRITSRMESIDATIGKLLAEEEEAKRSLDAMRAQLAEQDAGQAVLGETVLEAERAFHAMEEKKQSLRGEIDQLQNRAFELQGLIGEKMTRIDFLTGLVDRLEGYSESVQHLLRSRDWSSSRYGTVADAVNTRDDLRVAVEAALGDAAHFILVNDVPEALSGLANLRDNRKGKATFVCLSRVPQMAAAPFPIAGDGVVGWAIDLVRYDATYNDLFQFLLHQTLIVRDADVAAACMREYPQVRCVTLGGDIFDVHGVVRGGSHGQEEGGLIGKKDQIARLNAEVGELKVKLVENQEVLEEKNFEYADIDLRRYAEAMKQTQQDLSAHERRVAQMMFEVEKFERIISKNGGERSALSSEHAELELRIGELAPCIEEVRAAQGSVESEVTAESGVLAELERRYNQSNEELNASTVSVVQKRGEIQNLRNEFERLTRSQQETQETYERAESEIAHAQETAAALAVEITRLGESLVHLRQMRGEQESGLHVIEEELASKRAEAERLERVLHDDRVRHNQTVALVHEMELKISEIRQKIEMLEQHARDDYEMTLERRELGEDDVFDLGQAKDEIQDLRIKLKTLGLVNPLAFEEWKKEKERFDLLTTQRQDLLESQQTLRDTIQEINETAQMKFTETFTQVRENFISIFKSLFDEGDEADLTLEEANDPLEAKIDIMAKPRGKRPHSIDMLSGGEKTLTAIALLFAIYLVKPSPFCILDEVDAPLDDANIDRFIRIIRRFSANTQFIVVTHNKRTMAAADTLYGVTMEEEGVSKIVAVNFETDNIGRFTQN